MAVDTEMVTPEQTETSEQDSRRTSGCEVIDFFAKIPREAARKIREQEEYLAALSPEELAELDRQREYQRQLAAAPKLRKEIKGRCGLVGDMWECTFANRRSHLDSDSVKEGLRKVRKLVDALPDFEGWKPGKRCLILHGDSGAGKSHIAKAAVIECIEKAIPVEAIYVDCIQLEKTLVSRNSPAARALHDRIINAQFAVLDDFDKALFGNVAAWVTAWVKLLIEDVENRGGPALLVTTNADQQTYREALAEQDWLLGRLIKKFSWHGMVSAVNWWLEIGESEPEYFWQN